MWREAEATLISRDLDIERLGETGEWRIGRDGGGGGGCVRAVRVCSTFAGDCFAKALTFTEGGSAGEGTVQSDGTDGAGCREEGREGEGGDTSSGSVGEGGLLAENLLLDERPSPTRA